MKKIFYSLMVAVFAAFTFTSCEDVPMPYDQPGTGGGSGSTAVDPVGTGTAADPYNIAALNAFAKTLEQGQSSEDVKYFRGKVVSFKSGEEPGNTYGNTTFYISDDGTSKNQFYVYRCKGPGNSKITDPNLVKEGDEVVVCGKITNYNGTLETEQNTAYIVSINGTGSSVTPGTTAEPAGAGTAADPYNVAKANEVAAALEKSSTSASYLSDEVYVKGKICSITDTELSSYGNITYYISDDGTTAGQLEVYRGLSLNGAKFKALSDIKVGDEVVVKGKLQNWLGTLEFTQGSSLVSINGTGSTGGGNDDKPTGEAKGTGTKDDPFNAVAANLFASKLASGANSEPVYVKGKVSRTKDISVSYKNATFYISEDGTQNDEFYVFRCKGLDNTDIATANDVMVGDDVVIYGPLTNYQGNTPETVQNECYIVSIVHNSTPGTGNDEGGSGSGGTITENSIVLTPADMGIANGIEIGTYTLADGTVLDFDGGGNTNVPKYYNSGTNIRMYPKNSVTITAKKKIASVFFDCDTYNGILCNADGEVSITNGTASKSAASLLFNNVNSTTTKITNTNGSTGSASQIRITKLVINYAE